MNSRIGGADEFAATFRVSREITEKLAIYERLLRHWQRTINLVAPSTLDDVWHRHFADSAQLLRFAPPSAERWVDLGSGAGFPGLVLAILMRDSHPDARVRLIESDTRKAAFLREVARQTATPVEISASRIEIETTQDKVGEAHVVSARALAPLDRLFELSKPLFGPGTRGLFLKGRDAEKEIRDAGTSWVFNSRREPSLTDPEARIVIVECLKSKTEV